MTQTYRPLPKIRPDNEPFWTAAREHRLLIQHCKACGRYQHYPRLLCRHCQAFDLEWVHSPGNGTVYTCSVVYRSPGAFAEDIPYATAVVELDEGPRIFARVVGCDPESVHIGMAVRAAFQDQGDGLTYVVFEPRR